MNGKLHAIVRNFTPAIVATFGIGSFAASAGANQISIKLGNPSAGVTNSAGVSPQSSNWNNDLSASGNTSFSNQVDNTGFNTGVSLTTAVGIGTNGTASQAQTWMNTGDAELFTGYDYTSGLNSGSYPVTITLSNIPATYQTGYYVDLFVDAIIPTGASNPNNYNYWTVTDGTTKYYFGSDGGTSYNGGYVDGQSTTALWAGTTNYVQYYETGSGETFTFAAPSTFGYTGGDLLVFGAQIVQVPEPASVGLIAITAFGSTLRRRRVANAKY